jgi:hypothetical protein
MKEERWVLIRATKYDIDSPKFFETYYKAHEEMKRQYEFFSRDCVGELNDDDAWCMEDDNITNWKIFCIE